MEELCDLSVRGLEELIDYQDYPIEAAEYATKARRSLGVGYIGLAHYLAKLGFRMTHKKHGILYMNLQKHFSIIF